MNKVIEPGFQKVTVFVGAVEDFSKWNKLPKYAVEQLNEISNPRVAAEKRAGFALLCFGAEKLNLDFDVTKCYIGDTGKPLNSGCFFSVSHSKGIAAVAIADFPVGLDIETVESLEKVKRLEKRIVYPGESYNNPLELWTMKEAVFKLQGKDRIFRPVDIDTASYYGKSGKFGYNGKVFAFSIAAAHTFDAEVYWVSEEKISDKKLDIW